MGCRANQPTLSGTLRSRPVRRLLVVRKRRQPEGAGTKPPASHTAEPAQASTRFTDERALSQALKNRELPQAESAPVVQLVRSDADGFNWSSALIGAIVPFVLILAGVVAGPALTRRRTRTSALA